MWDLRGETNVEVHVFRHAIIDPKFAWSERWQGLRFYRLLFLLDGAIRSCSCVVDVGHEGYLMKTFGVEWVCTGIIANGRSEQRCVTPRQRSETR